MRLADRRCPKCDNFRDVRADFCTQPRKSISNEDEIICELSVSSIPHQHFRCKKCKHHWIELTEIRGLNI